MTDARERLFGLLLVLTTAACGGRTDLGAASEADGGDAACQPIGQSFVVKDGSTECSQVLQCEPDDARQYFVDCSCATSTCTCSRVLASEKPELLKTFSVTSCPCTMGLPPPRVMDPSVAAVCGLSF